MSERVRFVTGCLMLMMLTVSFTVVGIALGKVMAERSNLRECLAHQEWCVEHYQLEEGK